MAVDAVLDRHVIHELSSGGPAMHVPKSSRYVSIMIGGSALALALSTLPVLRADAAGTPMGEVFAPSITCTNTTTTESTIIQTASPNGSYSVPDDGVITSWSFTVGTASPTTVAFRLGRASGAATGFDIVGAGPKVAVFGQSVVNEPVRIPARRGDRLGLYIGAPASGTTATCAQPANGYSAIFSDGDNSSGPLVGDVADVQLDVTANLEPDADHDGYGDITQDHCSYDPTTQKACAAPKTSITSRKVMKSKVVIRFASSKPGSTFECAVSSPIYRHCSTPFTVKTRAVKQVFGVRAVDASGVADRTAAIVKIKAGKPSRQ